MAKKRKGKYKFTGISLPLVLVAILLTCVGIVMVFSSSYADSLIVAQRKNKTADYMRDVLKQSIVAAAALLIMFIVACLDYHIFQNPAFMFLTALVAIGLLILALMFEGVRNSRRWVELGGFTFQSSEFAKLAAVLYTSFFVTANRKWYKSVGTFFITVIPIVAMAGLIYAEPDLSTTLCFCITVAVIMYVVGIPWWFELAGAAGIAGLVLFKVLDPDKYQGGRISAWLEAWNDPSDNGYQIVQSLYAIGDGGLFGVGLGNSKQKISNLPMADSDYIFSILSEEFGFFLTLAVVGLYVAYVILGIKTALNADDLYGTCLAMGVTTMIGVQAGFNMAVATNVMPSTGLTLPFISSGASSLLISIVSTGVLLSVSGHKNINKIEAREKRTLSEAAV